MATIERLTIRLPSEMAAVVRGAVDGSDYASTSEVVREAFVAEHGGFP
ncbi:MAG: ribbon-helix-helix protein, CopG family [Alphaproteobacteria bacterium]|nr:ribbon-helix-helix protein, CopG family [Alphaproteobacteria bacterium]